MDSEQLLASLKKHVGELEAACHQLRLLKQQHIAHIKGLEAQINQDRSRYLDFMNKTQSRLKRSVEFSIQQISRLNLDPEQKAELVREAQGFLGAEIGKVDV